MTERPGPERARTFSISPGSFTLPDLTALPRVATVADGERSTSTAVWFDTLDLRLAERSTSIRCSGAGPDEGWTLRTTAADGSSSDVRTASAPRRSGPTGPVPTELAELVRGSVRDRSLVPVAALRSVRSGRLLLDVDGRELARVSDDELRGERYTSGTVELTAWREIEVEVTGGDDALLEALGTSLRRAAATPTDRSRLDRVLGREDLTVIDLRDGARDGSVAEFLVDRLDRGVAGLLAQDRAVRNRQPDGVHGMRDATRRLRFDLATWQPFLDERRTDGLHDDLHWLATLLGGVRDAEVLDERLTRSLVDLAAEQVEGPVVERIRHELDDRRSAASTALTEALEDERYFAMLDVLERLVQDPPLTARAGRPADQALARRMAHSLARVDRALAALDEPAPPGGRSEQLHDVRKAAKRAGAAAEALELRFGRPARRLAERMAELRDVLGEHHDSVMAADAIRDIGGAAHRADESAVTYGVLHGIELDRRTEAEGAFEVVRASLGSGPGERWLDG